MGREGKFKLGTEQNWIIGTHFPSTNGLISVKTQKQDLPLFVYSLDSMGSQINKSGLKLNIQETKIMASDPITSWQIDGRTMETVRDFYFGGLQNHCRWWLQPWNLKTLAHWKRSYDQPRQHIRKQRHYFANKGPSSQSYGFSHSNVCMWELD